MIHRGQTIGLLILAAIVVACSGPGAAVPGGVAQGNRAPDFTLETLEGHRLSLSQYRGQVVLVNLWATWCLPCQSELPALEAAYRAHKEDGFVVLGVNVRQSRQEVLPLVREFGLTYPILLDESGKLMNDYRVRGLPTSFILDREGVIQVRHLGSLTTRALEDYLARLLR